MGWPFSQTVSMTCCTLPAEDYFKQAIALGPQWADPHSALGSQYFFLGALGSRPPSEMIPLARAEAWKALELLPSEPVAHVVLGAIAAVHDYDWKEADEQFKLARLPNLSLLQFTICTLSSIFCRWDGSRRLFNSR